MTAAAFLITPKPAHECYRFQLPVCPPPPRVTHKPMTVDLDSSPSLTFPGCFRNEISVDSDSFPTLNLPVCFGTEFSSSETLKRSFPAAPGPGVSKRSRSSITMKPLLAKRSQATKQLPALRLKPRPSKYTAPSRSSSLMRSPSKTNLSMSRSTSFQQLMSGGNKRSSLRRRPSFSRAA